MKNSLEVDRSLAWHWPVITWQETVNAWYVDNEGRQRTYCTRWPLFDFGKARLYVTTLTYTEIK